MQALRRLSRRRSARTESATFLLDGPVLLAEALAAGTSLRSIYVEPSGLDSDAFRLARSTGVDIQEVQAGALAKVLDLASPQSVVAVADIATVETAAVLSAAVALDRPVLVLVEVQDPGNAGTLIRVAEAAGCAGVVLTERSVDVHNPKTVRATAGAVLRLPVAEGANAAELIQAAKGMDMASWATVKDGGTSLDHAPLVGSCLLLIGSEAHGLPDDIVAAATDGLTIPMDGAVESLNAAVAGALVAFEAARQRRTGAGLTAQLRQNVGDDANPGDSSTHEERLE